jgi:hypothetical protein
MASQENSMNKMNKIKPECAGSIALSFPNQFKQNEFLHQIMSDEKWILSTILNTKNYDYILAKQ